MTRRTLSIFVAVFALAGCATPASLNAPLSEFNPAEGYRFSNLASEGNSDEVFVVLALSGGGTRAAALSYGVLQQLRDTTVHIDGQERPLLKEVDVISAISGGSFTAAYYAAFGEKLFTDFEDDVLKSPIRSAIARRAVLLPHNWFRLYSSKFDMADLAERYYAERVFAEKKYRDLIEEGRRPYLIINATDMTLAAPFEFTQDQFDLLYSDLGELPLAKAVAASAAYPCLLAGIVIRNFEHRPGFEAPGWIAAGLEGGDGNYRRRQKALQADSYTKPATRPYIHLLDGGVVDNLGLEPVLWSLSSEDCPWSLKEMLRERRVKKLVIIAVNATVKPMCSWDQHVDRPTVGQMFSAAMANAQDNKALESLARLHELCDELENEYAADGVDVYVIEVSFANVADESEREEYNCIPTDLQLPEEVVDDITSVAAKLLLDSPEYQRLLADLNGRQAPIEP